MFTIILYIVAGILFLNFVFGIYQEYQDTKFDKLLESHRQKRKKTVIKE